MSLDDDFNTVVREIQTYDENISEIDLQETIIAAKMNALRLELAKLKDNRDVVKRSIREAYKTKESIERKMELEAESRLIAQAIAAKREEAEKLIADAPWRHTAYEWQIEGALKLPERALLGDRRGMGKTLSAIIWRRIQNAKKTLVCVRREVASDFIKELSIREPNLFVYPMLGANSEGRKIAAMLLNSQEEFVVVTNIESWRRSVDDTTEDILKIDYDAIILDEAHHIKNTGTGTAQGFFRLAKKIPKVLELTGTPIKNRPPEMFSLLHALYPNLFPSESRFLRDYCTPMGQNKYIFSNMGLKSLVAKIDTFYLARGPEDVGRQVPPPKMIEYKLNFDSHPLQKKAYQDMSELNMAVLDSGKVVPIISQLAVMTRQAQMVSWPAGIKFDIKDEDGEVIETIHFDIQESVKADWAEDLLIELVEEGERAVLFSRFKPVIYELRRRLVERGLSVAVITGDEKKVGNTKEIFDDFDLKTAPENPKYQVLLATYQTVGESANLNAARHVVLYDRYWNPGNDDQAIGRIDRINSVDQATVHLPSVEESIDDYMIDLIDGKRNIVTEFKDAATMQKSLLDHLKKTT